MPEESTSKIVRAADGAASIQTTKRVLTAEEREEQRLIRRMQTMMNMVMSVIAQDRTISIDEASQMIADARTATLHMFPGKELAYDLIWKPRFQRLMQDRFRLN